MKKVLVIGSTCVDMILKVDQLPSTAASMNIYGQDASVGGCAYNVYDTLRNFGIPSVLFTPVGTGIYGDFIRYHLGKKGISVPTPPVQRDNGCCYCFVEKNGERTFISYHGAEYFFEKEWFAAIDPDRIHSVYVCGLELEETTGHNILDWLEEHPELPVFFAPGPRIAHLQQDRFDRLLRRRVMWHLNEDEVKYFTGRDTVEEAVEDLYKKTKNTVFVTLGEKGAVWYDGEESGYAPPVPAARVEDTIGAGDSHAGAVLAGLYRGESLRRTVETANRISSAVVEHKGARLPKEVFDRVMDGTYKM